MRQLLNELTMERLARMAASGRICHRVGNYYLTLATNGQLRIYDTGHRQVWQIMLDVNMLIDLNRIIEKKACT